MPHIFWIAFTLTFLLLLVTLWAGLTKRRVFHLVVASTSFVRS